MNMEYKRIAKLVEDYKSGDESAFDRIYSLMYSKQYYFAYKTLGNHHAAEDVTQDAFIKIYKSIKSLDNPITFINWANRITYNCCMDYVKADKKQNYADQDIDEQYDLADTSLEGISPENVSLKKEVNNHLLAAMNGLDMDSRAILVYKYYYGFKDSQIADIMECPVGTIKSRLFKSKDKLKSKMTGLYSLAPMLFLNLAMLREASSLMVVPTAVLVGIGTRAVATLTGLAVTMVCITQIIPQMVDVSIEDPSSYVASQTVQISSKIPAAIKKAELIIDDGQTVEMSQQGNLWETPISNNGSYVVRITDSTGLTTDKDIEINNIDNTAPYQKDAFVDGNTVNFVLSDDTSGIDYDTISIIDSQNKLIEDKTIDETKGTISFDISKLPAELMVADNVGNYTVYQLTKQNIER